MWTPQQRLEIGEHAAKNGNAWILRFLSLKYLRLTKQSITNITYRIIGQERFYIAWTPLAVR